MSVRSFKGSDTVYIIVADCGGGDDLNPHRTLASAMERVRDETGIEIFKTDYNTYLSNPDWLTDSGCELVYSA